VSYPICSQTNSAKSIIDWDDVAAIPLKLSAISIKDLMWVRDDRNSNIVSETKLDSKQAQLFEHELSRLEQEAFFFTEWSQMFLHSKENQVLFFLLRRTKGMTLAYLRRKYPEIMSEALYRSPETLKLAASEWKVFTDEYFISHGWPVPDWPQYVEIQEELELYERSSFERTLRRFKRNAQKWLKMLWCQIGRVWGNEYL
jgi:hypothetical protein